MTLVWAFASPHSKNFIICLKYKRWPNCTTCVSRDKISFIEYFKQILRINDPIILVIFVEHMLLRPDISPCAPWLWSVWMTKKLCLDLKGLLRNYCDFDKTFHIQGRPFLFTFLYTKDKECPPYVSLSCQSYEIISNRVTKS